MHATIEQTRSVFRKAKVPPKPDQLRHKQWRAPVLQMSVPDKHDPTWTKRCRDYWALQEQIFGFKAAEIVWSASKVGDFILITTTARVERVIEGMRLEVLQ